MTTIIEENEKEYKELCQVLRKRHLRRMFNTCDYAQPPCCVEDDHHDAFLQRIEDQCTTWNNELMQKLCNGVQSADRTIDYDNLAA